MNRSEAVLNYHSKRKLPRLESQHIIHAIRRRQDLEEAAGAYKNIDEVMANRADLVRILTTLSPIAVIKG